MAKMFYSLEEATEKLGISEDEIKEMAANGDLQQFRDRDKLMFKREQIDALVEEGTDELGDLGSTLDDYAEAQETSSGTIPLVDDDDAEEAPGLGDLGVTDTDMIDLVTSDSDFLDQSPLESSSDESFLSESSLDESDQIALDDADLTDTGPITIPDQDTADPAGATQITDSPMGDDDDGLLLEQIGSGSGLLDLTREIDDTSLGTELLDEIYPADSTGLDTQTDQADHFDPAITSSGIFDGSVELDISTSGLENLQSQDFGEPSSVVPSSTFIPHPAETQTMDYSGNGLSIGMLLVALVTLFVTLTVTIYAVSGVPSSTAVAMAKNPLAYSGGLLVLAIVLGGAGMMFGKMQKR